MVGGGALPQRDSAEPRAARLLLLRRLQLVDGLVGSLGIQIFHTFYLKKIHDFSCLFKKIEKYAGGGARGDCRRATPRSRAPRASCCSSSSSTESLEAPGTQRAERRPDTA